MGRFRPVVWVVLAVFMGTLVLSGCGSKDAMSAEGVAPDAQAAPESAEQVPAGMQQAAQSASQAVDQLNTQSGEVLDDTQ